MYWMAPKKGPEPGAYEVEDLADATAPLEAIGKPQKARVQTAVSRERRKQSSVFSDPQDRFDLKYSNSHVRLLSSKGAPKRKYMTQTADKKVIFA